MLYPNSLAYVRLNSGSACPPSSLLIRCDNNSAGLCCWLNWLSKWVLLVETPRSLLLFLYQMLSDHANSFSRFASSGVIGSICENRTLAVPTPCKQKPKSLGWVCQHLR